MNTAGGIAQLIEHWALGHEVLGSNLPLVVLKVTLSGHSSGSLTIPRCKIRTRPQPGNSELTLRIIIHKWEQSAGDDGSTLGLKPMGRVNWHLKQRIPATPQNGDLSPQIKKRNIDMNTFIMKRNCRKVSLLLIGTFIIVNWPFTHKKREFGFPEIQNLQSYGKTRKDWQGNRVYIHLSPQNGLCMLKITGNIVNQVT